MLLQNEKLIHPLARSGNLCCAVYERESSVVTIQEGYKGDWVMRQQSVAFDNNIDASYSIRRRRRTTTSPASAMTSQPRGLPPADMQP